MFCLAAIQFRLIKWRRIRLCTASER